MLLIFLFYKLVHQIIVDQKIVKWSLTVNLFIFFLNFTTVSGENYNKLFVEMQASVDLNIKLKPEKAGLMEVDQ